MPIWDVVVKNLAVAGVASMDLAMSPAFVGLISAMPSGKAIKTYQSVMGKCESLSRTKKASLNLLKRHFEMMIATKVVPDHDFVKRSIFPLIERR